MKIGIMGGTFNPIHNAHLALAEAAKKQYALDVIWFMPSGLPAHKSNCELISSEHRFHMVELATMDTDGYVASDFELKREGYTYTFETLTRLQEQYPNDTFYFIIGGDSLSKFTTWKHPEIIAQKAILLATGRSGYLKQELTNTVQQLYQMYPDIVIHLVDMPESTISSHQIREEIRCGNWNQIMNEVPQKVYDYLKEHHIYETN